MTHLFRIYLEPFGLRGYQRLILLVALGTLLHSALIYGVLYSYLLIIKLLTSKFLLMSDSQNAGFFVAILWIVTIALSILSGIIAWDWVEPDSFFGFIGFLLVWGLLSKVGHFLAMGIVALLGGMK